MDSLNNIDFKKLASQQKSIQMKMRLLALAHFKDGHSRTQIAKFLKVSRTSVNNWVATYLKNGVEGLVEKLHTGHPPRLTEEQLSLLKLYITSNAIKPEGGRLQGTDIIEFIHEEFGLSYSLSGIYKILRKLNLVWITTRSKHPKQSVEAQEAFKKFQIETIHKIPGHVALKDVQIWFQDEARFSQRNTTTRIWAKKGTRPRAVQQQQFEYAYLFGAV